MLHIKRGKQYLIYCLQKSLYQKKRSILSPRNVDQKQGVVISVVAVLIKYMAQINNIKYICTKTVHPKSRLSCKKYFSSETSSSIMCSAKQVIGWQKQK
ncbi:MAG: hypothetical protein KDI39_07745 [Pseudomonadales bacterium]|nr:hypothetical protein [Pseudomonadales bacterium]